MAQQPAHGADAFILHTWPYRETSLIVETFTQAQGRVAMVARGAKRPNSALRGVLNPFQRLTLAWFGRAEMKTLKTAEYARIYPQMRGQALLSAFYMNELLLNLAHREDPHEALFLAYDAAIVDLSDTATHTDVRRMATCLRRFELALLRELGYALQLTHEADTGAPIESKRQYCYLLERGPVALERLREADAGDGLQLRGQTLLDLASDALDDSVTRQQAKNLLRMTINAVLGNKPLHTRQIIRELAGT